MMRCVAVPSKARSICIGSQSHPEQPGVSFPNLSRLPKRSLSPQDRMKTTSVAIIMCLNIGVDPPDILKVRQSRSLAALPLQPCRPASLPHTHACHLFPWSQLSNERTAPAWRTYA